MNTRRGRLAAALALVLASLLAASGCSGPAGGVRYVDRLVIVNSTAYDVNVDVGSGDGSSWVALGTARHDGETPFEEVVDQGDRWVVRLGYGGEEGGEVSVRRDVLARNGWRVSVPSEVAERLKGRGVTPPP